MGEQELTEMIMKLRAGRRVDMPAIIIEDTSDLSKVGDVLKIIRELGAPGLIVFGLSGNSETVTGVEDMRKLKKAVFKIGYGLRLRIIPEMIELTLEGKAILVAIVKRFSQFDMPCFIP